jgi:hypothetical protein
MEHARPKVRIFDPDGCPPREAGPAYDAVFAALRAGLTCRCGARNCREVLDAALVFLPQKDVQAKEGAGRPQDAPELP